MFNQNVAIVVGENTTHYGLISVANSDSRRANAGADIGAPDVLTISHETKGKGIAAVDRHLVRIDTTFVAADATGNPVSATASAYVVLVMPHNVVTKSNLQEAWSKIVNFLSASESGATETNFNRVLNGEP